MPLQEFIAEFSWIIFIYLFYLFIVQINEGPYQKSASIKAFVCCFKHFFLFSEVTILVMSNRTTYQSHSTLQLLILLV